GGDPVMTTALAAALQQDNSAGAIAADLEVAANYETYLDNTEIINLLIATNPDSAFAAGWELTLLRAEELGLNHLPDSNGFWTTILDAAGTAPVDRTSASVPYTGHETIVDNNGVLVEEIYFNADGTQTRNEYFQNLTENFDNTSIYVPDGSTYTIAGSN